MTREEAKHWLEIELKTWEDECKSKHPIKEALSVAIKVLEQEPCEDAISRQAVLALAKEECDTAIIPYRKFVKDVNALLPVTPQPKTGHWIIIDDCEQFVAKCSECGRIEDSRMISKYPYCRCGAKMIEPQESEDKE